MSDRRSFVLRIIGTVGEDLCGETQFRIATTRCSERYAFVMLLAELIHFPFSDDTFDIASSRTMRVRT